MDHPDIADIVGTNVRAGRSRKGLTRKQLAVKAGVSERYLNELEHGASNASIAVLAKVAAALGRTVVDLMIESAPGRPQALAPELSAILGSLSIAEQVALAPAVQALIAERRRASKGVALLGLRGAGKSTLGRRLAERFGVPLVSVTREIEQRAGMQLNEIFNLGGPEAYRAMENDVVAEIVERGGKMVLETAGGVAGNNDALAAILARFKTVWLKASPEEHLARVARQGDLRPMQGNPRALENLKALLASREPEYAKAEATIDTTGRSLDDVFAELTLIAEQCLLRT